MPCTTVLSRDKVSTLFPYLKCLRISAGWEIRDKHRLEEDVLQYFPTITKLELPEPGDARSLLRMPESGVMLPQITSVTFCEEDWEDVARWKENRDKLGFSKADYYTWS